MKRNATRSVVRMTARLVFLLTPASTLGTSAPPRTVPDDVRALLVADDMALAYYKGDVTGEGKKGLVLVVYHGLIAASEEPDSGDPCDLIVYEDLNDQWKEVTRSDDAVDCTNNQLADRPKELIDMDYLQVSPGSITYVNQNIRSNVIFDFFYDKTKRGWYVQSMSQNFVVRPKDPEGDLGSGYGDIAAPHDFPLMPMKELNAARLWPLLIKHTKIEF